jgi:glycosyltransferase involved in cell wall biosynthesis
VSDENRKPLRILCLSPLFAPLANAEAFVGAKLALALMERGAQVYTISDGSLPITEGGPPDDSPAWAPLRDVSEAVIQPPGAGRLSRLAKSLRYGASGGWIDLALKRARLLHAEKPFDWVFSRSVPRRAHVAGYWCSKELGTRWAVSINDPWEYFFNPEWDGKRPSRLRVALVKHWLRCTLQRADLVCCPSRRLGDSTRRLVGSTRTIETLPHVGWARDGAAEPGLFHLIHAGNLGVEKRRADGLLEGLRRFLDVHPGARDRVRLTLIGPGAEERQTVAREFHLEGVVVCTGRVSYEESLRRIASASMCVLVEARMSEGIYLPSKFADYVVARKPVLALSPRIGTISDLLPDPGIVLREPDDAEGIADALARAYEDFTAGRFEARRPSEALARTFEARSLAEQFLALLRARDGS